METGKECTENSPEEKDLGVLVVDKFDVSQYCMLAIQKANCIFGCIERSVTIRARDMTVPLYSTLVRLHLQYCDLEIIA